MKASPRPLAEHHRRLDLLVDQIMQLRQALPPRTRLVIGLIQALRAVLAASIGYFVALELGLGQGFWAAITAISVSQANYAEVRSSSRDQFVGAMIGGLIGMGAATFGHDHYLAYVLAVIIGMLLCSVFNLGAAGRISGTTTTIIMLVPHAGAFWQFALFRLGEVTLGAAAALLVSWLFGTLEQRLFRDARPRERGSAPPRRSPRYTARPSDPQGLPMNDPHDVTREQAEEAVRTLLRWAGEDPAREGLLDTPKRVVKAYRDWFSGYESDPADYLRRTFKEVAGYDEMVVLRDIEFESHCEHHMAPIIGRAHVGYLPTNRVVGISKLARVVDGFARRFQVQEKLTAEIAQCIQETLQPAGVAVVVDASHECMTTRGVHKRGVSMVTSQMLGTFRDDARTRAEFLQFIGIHGGSR